MMVLNLWLRLPRWMSWREHGLISCAEGEEPARVPWTVICISHHGWEPSRYITGAPPSPSCSPAWVIVIFPLLYSSLDNDAKGKVGNETQSQVILCGPCLDQPLEMQQTGALHGPPAGAPTPLPTRAARDPHVGRGKQTLKAAPVWRRVCLHFPMP